MVTATIQTSPAQSTFLNRISVLLLLSSLWCTLPLAVQALSTPLYGSAAPEISTERANHVGSLLNEAFSSLNGDSVQRYATAREMAKLSQPTMPSHELVYGELSVPVLATILDAVGVRKGDAFLDIGSGDGALVLGAAMMYPDFLRASRGLELVPGLVDRSVRHRTILEERQALTVPTEFCHGDVHGSEPAVLDILGDTTLAVCFATTWSAGNAAIDRKDGEETHGAHGKPRKRNDLQGRSLPKLSKALARMPDGARIVVVDGRLNRENGHQWEGDLRIDCPDTAPFSIASLYRLHNSV